MPSSPLARRSTGYEQPLGIDPPMICRTCTLNGYEGGT